MLKTLFMCVNNILKFAVSEKKEISWHAVFSIASFALETQRFLIYIEL